MKSLIQDIHTEVVYEMLDGVPIYYKGYKAYLDGTKEIEEIMRSSVLQSMIISRLMFLLQLKLGLEYEVLSNELGIQFAKKSWRAADIAIVKSEDIEKIEAKNKYLSFAPEIVIEIDTKAELSEIQNPLGYYQDKTDQLLKFGVKKVIWIFTENKKVMVAEKDNKWEISNWTETINILDELNVSIEELLKKRK